MTVQQLIYPPNAAGFNAQGFNVDGFDEAGLNAVLHADTNFEPGNMYFLSEAKIKKGTGRGFPYENRIGPTRFLPQSDSDCG